MIRLPLPLLIVAVMLLPATALAENRLAPLELVAQAVDGLQPGLQSYQATIQTDRIATMIQAMTAGMPAEMARPEVPTVIKYWRRGAPRSVIVASGAQASPFLQQMVQRISASLAIEPEELILPPGRGPERQRLAAQALVKTSDTALAEKILQRVEIVFPGPTDIGSSFYGTGLRLPQNEIAKLQFDIDTKAHTVSELTVQTAAEALYVAEFRYRAVPGGMAVERMRVTSPDGKVDDRLEVTFNELSGYLLPEKTERSLNRPGLQDQLAVTFTGYRINQPFPADVEAQFASLAKPAVPAP